MVIRKIDYKKGLPPIPKGSVEGWRKIPVRECREKLVPLGIFSDFSDCDTNAVYFGESGKGKRMNFVGESVDRRVSLITHFVREGILEKLKKAQRLMPKGFYFRFVDTYRPLEVQQALYDFQKNKFKKMHSDWSRQKLEDETQKYVSLPSPDKKRGTIHPSPHSTGGVVDLSVIKLSERGEQLLKKLEQEKASGKLDYPVKYEEEMRVKVFKKWINEASRKGWASFYKKYTQKNLLSKYRYAIKKAEIFKKYSETLDMGARFDHFGPESATRYFEDLIKKRRLNDKEKKALHNRRLLYWVIKKAGFSTYPDEWWHLNSGDNMDAVIRRKKFAIYGTAVMSKENIAFEKMRKGLYSLLGKIKTN